MTATDGAWCVVALWLAATVAWQVPPLRGRVVTRFPRTSQLGLVPMWSFFAPHPPTRDIHLFWCARPVTGPPGAWREIPIVRSPRPTDVVWQPGRRRYKAVVHAVEALEREVHRWQQHRDDPFPWRDSVSYRYVLDVVRAHADSADPLRFAVADATHDADGRFLFRRFQSPTEPLDAA